ncbi:MAG: hypothetical protein HYW23_04170 [Candidatus Aenigmarchaeota archaeon]|nr:hypothetical protein [Candidatus Aenigmarchaeota archaeon]
MKKKEITLIRPKISFLRGLAGLILVFAGIGFLLIAVIAFITVIGFFAGLGFFAISFAFFAGGYHAFTGSTRFKCPYCKNDMSASPDSKSIRCNRCREWILLKWDKN